VSQARRAALDKIDAMKALFAFVWKTLVSAVAGMFGLTLGAALVTALGAALPAVPPATDPGAAATMGILASVALAAGLVPLASGLAVGFVARWTILGVLVYVCLGINTAIESAIFTTFGGTAGMLVFNLVMAVVLAAALAGLFRSPDDVTSWSTRWHALRAARPTSQWAWRLAAAVLVFPAIYLAFGNMVAPIVVEPYRAGRFGLVLPGYGTILPVQVVRSALFLAASVPALVAWRGSRVRLALALGAAHFVLDGLFGMLLSHWLPLPMRAAHTVEILGDSLVYAAVLVVLLLPPREGDERGRLTAVGVRAAG
jgi:hypothetical protein